MKIESLVQISNIKKLEETLDCGAEMVAVNANNYISRQEVFMLLELMVTLISKNIVKRAAYSFQNLEEIHRAHY